ncbi:unnamed protein product [Prorocentrum cordatum]|uniref:Ribosome biogenesis regulatory protein n=1 Tax=Prorocentrum cordatum TaxID=2364126 RepID=A0ABN9S8K3_9DINO|nr:unnamed protein product [Polarella glacialis]
MAAPKKSAFEDLQSFFEEADGAFDKMDVERTQMIGCLRKALEASGTVRPVRGSPWEEPAVSSSSASATLEVEVGSSEVGRTQVDHAALGRAVDEVLGDRAGDADDQVLPEGAAGRVQQFMNADPDFARIALLMAMDPLAVDWNDPAVINVEKALVLEFKCHKKFKARGPPGPLQGGPKEWRGQAWRAKSGRWGPRGGRSMRLAEFQAKFGKERGAQAFLEDEDRRRSLRLETFFAKFGKERGAEAFQEDEAARSSNCKGIARMMAVGRPKPQQPIVASPTFVPPAYKARPTPKMMPPTALPIARTADAGKGSGERAAKGENKRAREGKGDGEQGKGTYKDADNGKGKGADQDKGKGARKDAGNGKGAHKDAVKSKGKHGEAPSASDAVACSRA